MKYFFACLFLLFSFLLSFFFYRFSPSSSDTIGSWGQNVITKSSFTQFVRSQPPHFKKKFTLDQACSLFANRLALLETSFSDLSWLDTSRSEKLSYQIENLYLDAFLKYHENKIKNRPLPIDAQNDLKQKMSLKAHARIRFVSKRSIAQKIVDKKNLDYDTWTTEILYDSEWQWFVFEELDPLISHQLFSMKVGDTDLFFHEKNGWVTIELLSLKSRFKSQLDRPTNFDKQIENVYFEQELERWINSLVKKNPVKWNKKELENLWK